MSRFQFYVLFLAFVAISVGCDREEQSEPDSDATDAVGAHDADVASIDTETDAGACDRFCVWDRFMEQALSTVYAECICSLTSPAETPIQEGRVEICEDSYTQSEQVEYERDCVAAMTEPQLAELQTAVDCFDANIRGLLPCLDALEAGDVCGSCEPLDQPEGMPGRCPVSFETNTMIMNCTDGRPGF